MSAEEELYCSKCGEWRGQERYTCRQGGESVPKPAKQEAMSAEDRAAKVLADYLERCLNAAPEVDWPNARKAMELLSSEGLAVAAREDVPTRYEAKVGLLSLRETHGNGGGEGVKGLRAKLRRLSEADLP